MGLDRKYGRVTTEHGDIADDEPVVVFRAQDGLLVKVLAYYHMIAIKAGSPDRHLTNIMAALRAVEDWQANPHNHVKNPPDSRGPAGQRLEK